MEENQIREKLDTLADFQARLQYLALEKQRLISETIPAEIKARIDEIEAEFAGLAGVANEKIEELTAEIKSAVVTHGASVKGSYRQAVFVGGKLSWDGKGLDGYAVAHPEIKTFRKEGAPSVSIREVK